MVCGCSFSAISVAEEHWGTHFSEILAKRLDWDLVNLAYAGCSNGGIRLQIEEVIRQKPDFAIIIPTFFDRTEIPIHTLKLDWSKIIWNILDNITRTPLSYDPDRGIENINYKDSTNPALICENYNSIVHNWEHPYRKQNKISEQAVNAVKDYVSYLYDPGWKKQQDQWIIEHGCMELVKNNIPFILIPTMSLWQDDTNQLRLLDKKYYTINPDYCPCVTHSLPEYSLTQLDKDPGYHTNTAGQEYLANKYQEIMKDRWWNLCKI